MNESEDPYLLFKDFTTKGDREQLLEAFSIITNRTGRRIISQAASPHSPIIINQFDGVSEAEMVRYLHLLTHAGILTPIWDQGIRKFDLSPFGRKVASTLSDES
jgi:hypothetical protein